MTTAHQRYLEAKALEAIRPAHSGKNGWPFYRNKAERTKDYFENQYGWKLRPCTACNGSGYYDHNGSPDCGSCDGTGKERYASEKSLKASSAAAAAVAA
jgi:hypothetical protein